MADGLTNPERLIQEDDSDKTSRRRSHRFSRRKRSLRSTIRYHLDSMLRTRKTFRTGLVLLALAGFVCVSLKNDVLGPELKGFDSNRNDSFATTDTKAGEHPRFLPDLKTADNADSDRAIKETTTYRVNEGGSLWRTGSRFIEDDVLLDKLIDSLSENGMNVRSVRAGVEFIVNDFGSNGLSVVVEDGDDLYKSRIVKNGATSTVQTRVDTARTASLE